MVYITYFVHGTTTDNLQKLATGWLDGCLSEKGIEQAKALHELILDKDFDVVFCSDLKRAIDSAHIDFEGRDIEIIPDSRLRECNYGDYNGKDSKFAHYESHVTSAFPNGESMMDVQKRIKDFIVFLKEKTRALQNHLHLSSSGDTSPISICFILQNRVNSLENISSCMTCFHLGICLICPVPLSKSHTT